MISRKFLLFRFIISLAVAIGFCIAWYGHASDIWKYSTLVLLIYIVPFNLYFSACPHCGKRFSNGLVFNPFARSVGICNHCRNEVKYKELAAKGEYDEE